MSHGRTLLLTILLALGASTASAASRGFEGGVPLPRAAAAPELPAAPAAGRDFPGLSGAFHGAFAPGAEGASPAVPQELTAPPERAQVAEASDWAERSFAGLQGGSQGPVLSGGGPGGLVLPGGLGASPAQSAFGPGIDLHAHLFMKEGLTWMFRGNFFDPKLRATSWRARFSSQAHPASVNESGARVLVASLYAGSRLFTPFGLRESVRRQAGLARRFVAENPEWVLAGGPGEAARALAAGRRVLVLALEGAAGIMADPADVKEFHDLGVRIVTFLHLTDDPLGGAALLQGCGGFLINPWAGLSARRVESDGRLIRVNRRGLTDLGLRAAREFIDRGIWLDLSHASDESQKRLVPLLREAGQPLLYTHTALRRYQGVERGISLEQLRQVGRSGGLVGLIPSPDFLRGTPVAEPGGVEAFVHHYNEAARLVGSEGVVLGSDFNGALPHLRPTAGGREFLGERGLWSIAQEPAMWLAAARAGARLPADLRTPIQRFLEAWGRVAR